MIENYEILGDWKRTSLINNLKKGNICIMGWADKIAKLSSHSWEIFIRDKTGIKKFIVKTNFEKDITKLEKLTPESVIALNGKFNNFYLNLRNNGIKIFNLAHSPFPYSKKELDISSIKMLPKRQFMIKSPDMINILELRASVLKAIRQYMENNNLVEFSSQTIALATDPGVRTANLFTLPDYQKSPYVLSSSAQLYKQAALILDKVYTISPALRAEQISSKSTGRHLSEFWELDVEMAFTNYNEVMNFAERMLQYVIMFVIKNNKKELSALNSRLKIPKIPFPKISHSEAINLAKKKGIIINEGEELSWEAEKAISEEFNQPFWVIDYPTTSRAWYYRKDLQNPKIVRTMDLLYPRGFGEGITGGEREYDYNTLLKRIKEKGESPKKYLWYLDMFKYGMPPSAGFGLGIERLIRFLGNRKYIWETNMFPRVPGIVSP